MKRQIIIISILFSLASCQSKSDCFGGRKIVAEIETIVKYEKMKNSFFKEKEGVRYVACSFSDTLVNNQIYKAYLKLLKTEPNEKWIGRPCEITDIEILNNQTFESLVFDQKTLFTGGGGKTEKDETITIGIYITRTSDTGIEYEFSELIDSKIKREITGRAVFQSSINDKIETQHKKFESAFRFVDAENNIEILVSKDYQLNQCKSRLIEKDNSKISGLMYNK